MITIFIKQNQFSKNVDEYGNIFEVENEAIYLENGFIKIELEETYKDCVYQDFNEDLTFSVEKYNARKQKENEQLYVDKIVSKIRLKYSINDELAILRQATTKPDEFAEYNAYVEQCKAEVKEEMGV